MSFFSSNPSTTVKIDSIGVGGGPPTSATLMSTVSAAEAAPTLSVTIRLNVRVSPPGPTDGAVNDGVAVLAPVSVTVAAGI